MSDFQRGLDAESVTYAELAELVELHDRAGNADRERFAVAVRALIAQRAELARTEGAKSGDFGRGWMTSEARRLVDHGRGARRPLGAPCTSS